MVAQFVGNGTELDSTKAFVRYAYGRDGAETEEGVTIKSTVEHSSLQSEQNSFQIDIVFENITVAFA